jgi:hypothetical protein
VAKGGFEDAFAMKLRPVLLVVLLLAGFYYATTHLASTGALAHWLGAPHAANDPTSNIEAVRGPNGAFDLSVASAAPAYDEEEQQNIAVYKKAMPSVVNVTSTGGTFFMGRCRRPGRVRASS